MIQISDEIISLIKSHAERTYPEECCGFLLGKLSNEKVVAEILQVENSKESERNRRYIISPVDYLKAEKIAREKNLDIVGIYHSHPDHPATPSEFDREHAMPFFSYVIVSVLGGVALDVKSWVLSEDRSKFEFEEIKSFKNKL